MRKIRSVLYAGMLLVLTLNLSASAQAPPHAPGSICYTPQFWCWAPYPGPVGAVCACPTPNGWVSGRLG